MALNRQSPIPLYYQLAEQIREQIRQGGLRPGDQLPSERDLSERQTISRMTVRQAIDYLVREGTLVTRHGLGTFVAEPKLTSEVSHLLGFTETIMQRGGTASSRVLEQAVVAAPPRVAAGLGLVAGEPVVKVVRLRLSEQVPLLLETSYLPHAICTGLQHEELAHHSLYALLRERYGIQIERAAQTLEATLTNRFEADLFGIAVGAPMVLLEGIAYDQRERPIEFFKAVYRADRFKFAFSSQRGAAAHPEAELAHVSVLLA